MIDRIADLVNSDARLVHRLEGINLLCLPIRVGSALVANALDGGVSKLFLKDGAPTPAPAS